MKSSTKDDETRHQINVYEMTVKAIATLKLVSEKYYDASCLIGPNMLGSGGLVTPDIVVQGQDVNLVCEVKYNLPSQAKARTKGISQIRKYDQPLKRWPQKDVDDHDIVVITHLLHTVDFKDLLEKEAKRHNFRHNLCLVEFVVISGDYEKFVLRKMLGKFKNQTLDHHARKGITVSATDELEEIDRWWFYDEEPPPAYLMSVLWQHIFPSMVDHDSQECGGVAKRTDIETNLDHMVDKFEKSFGSKNPCKSWLRNAMRDFIRLKMAEKGVDETYLVHYKPIKANVLETMVKKHAKLKPEKRQPQSHSIDQFL